MNEAKLIWMDGEMVPWHEAKVHVLTHTLHYGNAVFEGTRAYQTKEGLAIFRLEDHCRRLYNSAKIVAIEPNIDYETVKQAHIDLLRANDFSANVYIRPLIYLGYGVMGLYHKHAPVQTMIAAWEWGAYLGEEGLENGIKVCTSSITRNPNRSTFGKAKAAANYLNSQMAKYEAIENGFEEALMLDENGFAAEGTGECLFIVRDGKLISPPNDNSLESITQATVLELAADMGIEVERRNITRDEIYIADEAFFTGTAAELTPINSLDHRIIGNGRRGPVTEKLQSVYFDVVYGRNEKYKHYLTFI
ncbi:branched-chain amino acid transaminase [Nitratifractor salsuginis]|uniref:Branched-chain-amino-acid aminotransferase n=1 Tax=Nitratifractor salsuginis (strain DSM 16511 / JCM 12458 / E9I37-1) TaxID=749222 RepID=E6X150_NITSE|nr:branched-chain amino acid transaminase [Nitratifractor salsuginis]ADV45853.1 branched chain amino acid aminotransferase apoenzyme [Nitratifractor salsuginis DSM 16511]